jgi:hypothetical protein
MPGARFHRPRSPVAARPARLSGEEVPARAAIAAPAAAAPVITLAKPAAYHRSVRASGGRSPLVSPGLRRRAPGSDPRRGGEFTGTSTKSSRQAATPRLGGRPPRFRWFGTVTTASRASLRPAFPGRPTGPGALRAPIHTHLGLGDAGGRSVTPGTPRPTTLATSTAAISAGRRAVQPWSSAA